METSEFISMVMSDASPADLTDSIKQMLYNRSVSMIDELKPIVAAQLFEPEMEGEVE